MNAAEWRDGLAFWWAQGTTLRNPAHKLAMQDGYRIDRAIRVRLRDQDE